MSLKCPSCGSTLSLDLAVEGLEVEPQKGTPKLEVVPQKRVGGIRSRTRFKYQDQGFLTFWSAYPRKIGKASAAQVWASITIDIEPQIIIDAATQFAKLCASNGSDPKFIPYPATWLHAGRWDDEPDATPLPKSQNLEVGSPEWVALNRPWEAK